MHRNGLFSPKPSATFGVGRMWVSSSELHGEPTDKPKRSQASFQRDYRGLIHMNNKHFLVGYVIEANHFPAIRRPTVLDGAGVRFRSWSDQRPDHDTWGCAVDLHSFACGHHELDGATEAIVPVAPFDPKVLLDVIPLGHPGPWEPWVGQRGLEVGVDDHLTFADRIEQQARERNIPVHAFLNSIEEDIDAPD